MRMVEVTQRHHLRTSGYTARVSLTDARYGEEQFKSFSNFPKDGGESLGAGPVTVCIDHHFYREYEYQIFCRYYSCIY